jgi:N-acetylglucosaminyldiphosphoundecaprenol N-acetyl-beta-D-mannosaminyltransferase
MDATAAAATIAARPKDAPFAYVVTPNADHIVRVSRDPALLAIYRDAWLCLLDSRVISILGGRVRARVPEVASGSDVTAALVTAHLQPDERITIIGMKPEWLPPLIARRGLAHPYHYDPPMGFDRDPAAMADTVAFVLNHPARLIFLAVGSPRQERLAAAIAATGRATGTGLCIGASLAFLAGIERRAPVWMRRRGLEWAFRLANDPVRLARRYLLDSPRVLPLLLRERRQA